MYKKAFKCNKCPQRNDENGCPMWWELVMTNDNGDTKVEKKCGYAMLPELMIETIRSSDHSAAAAYDMRNKVVDAAQKVLQHPQYLSINKGNEILKDSGDTLKIETIDISNEPEE
jgi:hypothetical protein